MSDGAGRTRPHVSVVICTRNRDDKIGDRRAPACSPTTTRRSTSRSSTRARRTPRARWSSRWRASDARLRYVHIDEAGPVAGLQQRHPPHRGRDPRLHRRRLHRRRRTGSRTIVDAFAAEPDGDLLYGQVAAARATTTDDRRLTPLLEIPAPERLSKHDGFKVFGMGANFAARRRLFDAAGQFDEMLGGGGPLWSSQDFDLAYRTYQSGDVILLRPEVTLRHDGRREAEDWPALLLAYGSGDGAFYMKHVRCRDPYALWLFARQLVGTPAHGRQAGAAAADEQLLPARAAPGVRGSFRFGVDRRAAALRRTRPELAGPRSTAQIAGRRRSMSACSRTHAARRRRGERFVGSASSSLDRRPQRRRRRRRGRRRPVTPSTIVSVWPVVRVQTTARPIDIASRIVVIPAWKSVSCSGTTTNGGVGVELAQVEQVEAARPRRSPGRRCRPSVGALRPRAGGGDDDVDVEAAHRLDERRVVAQLLADGADHRPRPGARSTCSGRQNSVSTMNGVQHDLLAAGSRARSTANSRCAEA